MWLRERESSGISSSSSVQCCCSVVSDSLQPHGLQHIRPSYLSPTPGVYSNSCPLSRWCHPTISSFVVPFSHLQSFPISESFQMSQFFASGGQSIRVSASASVLLVNIQDWFPLGLTGWISLLSKGLSRVFSNLNPIMGVLPLCPNLNLLPPTTPPPGNIILSIKVSVYEFGGDINI